MKASAFSALALIALSLSACTAAPAPAPAPENAPNTSEESGIVAVARCLQDRGWEPTVDEATNALEFSGTATQMEAYNADYEECTDRFGEQTVPFSEFTSEMWTDLYAQETATAECLRAHDVEVPPIPTFETFVQRYQSDARWTSYSFVPPASSADGERELNAACPQPEL